MIIFRTNCNTYNKDVNNIKLAQLSLWGYKCDNRREYTKTEGCTETHMTVVMILILLPSIQLPGHTALLLIPESDR